MDYDPQNSSHRQILADCLTRSLDRAGYSLKSFEGTKELVFTRSVNENIQVAVYTSIVDGACRNRGYDAIRVIGLYETKDGKHRGICRASKRVNRVGDVDEIVNRVRDRIHEVYTAALRPDCCSSCGAPNFTSKNGNSVCAELCWLSDEERNRPYQRQSRRRSYRRNY